MKKQSKKQKTGMTAWCLILLLSVVLTACGIEEQATEPAAEPAAEQTVESATEPTAESASESAAKPAAESAAEPAEPETSEAENTAADTDTKEDSAMQLMIGETEVPVTWEENASVEALREIVADSPLTIQMSMYGGFEQVGPIGQSIDREDQQTTTDPGDIVLYSGNQIVVFYGSNSWAYTRLGHIDLSKEEMTDLLANGDVVLTISKR